jgi:uncharacterized membrane protein
MQLKAAVTVHRPRDEVRTRWQSADHPTIDGSHAAVTFEEAPGGRGTEIHVDLGAGSHDGVLTEMVHKLTAAPRLAKAKDELRRFKQRVETGVVPRSEATPTGESVERKFKQRPAQPLEASEVEELGR